MHVRQECEIRTENRPRKGLVFKHSLYGGVWLSWLGGSVAHPVPFDGNECPIPVLFWAVLFLIFAKLRF